MKKEGVIGIIIIFLLIEVFSLNLVSAALGIGPAKQYVDFKPDMQLEYTFNVYADGNTKIEMYAKEEFADLVKFDKKELTGGGSFTVKIKLPGSIEKPGMHTLLIGAREKIDEDKEGIGVSIAVQAPIFIFVPYPGKYAEAAFSCNNANAGEPVKFILDISNLGKEPITAVAGIDIYSGKNKIETLNLGLVEVINQEKYTFKRVLNTTNYKSGDYNSSAIVDYGGDKKINTGCEFRLGSLFVNIVNYTSEAVKPGIKPFEINIESSWNNNLENVYGMVYVSNNGKNLTEFSTPGVSLSAWEKKTLKGYIDTNALENGEYDVQVRLNYAGTSSLARGKVKIMEKTNVILYVIIGVIALIILSIIALVIKYIFFRKKDKEKLSAVKSGRKINRNKAN